MHRDIAPIFSYTYDGSWVFFVINLYYLGPIENNRINCGYLYYKFAKFDSSCHKAIFEKVMSCHLAPAEGPLYELR
jgi:hypothetical protein